MIVLNVFQLWAKLPADEGSLKDNKIAFLNDPKGQKRFFTVIDGGRRSAIVNTCFIKNGIDLVLYKGGCIEKQICKKLCILCILCIKKLRDFKRPYFHDLYVEVNTIMNN